MGVLHDLSFGSVRVVFSDRTGGVGVSRFGSANLSLRVGDEESAVRENRRRLAELLGIDSCWFEVLQVHGCEVVEALDASIPPTPDPEGANPKKAPEADAIVTTAANLPAAISTADCVPVALGSIDPPGVAAVHAGWKGLLAGVVQAAARRLLEKTGALDWAVAGPSIGPCCYRVDDERLRLFEERFGPSAIDRAAKTLNLHVSVAQALRSGDLLPAGLASLGPCTFCSNRLFSFRRDGAPTGRQVMLAWIESRP